MLNPHTESTVDTAVGRQNKFAASPRTMRAVRLIAPRRIEVQNVEIPEPEARQVRIRVDGCGVCGSNLALWQGKPWFEYPCAPGAPGHEGWGTVDRCGPRVTEVSVGDRVAFLSEHAFAEYDIADASMVVPAPPAEKIFPGEALGCAVSVFDRSAIESGQTVAIIGIGFIGALLVQLAASAGARVIAISRRPFALDVARRCGARETMILENTGEVAGLVMDLTGGAGCARVIEAAGAQETLDLASALTAVRGRLVIAGYHQDSSRTIDMQLWNWRGIDVINAHERDAGVRTRAMAAAARLVTEGVVDPERLSTRRFSLDRAADAFTALEHRPEGFLKGWIRTNDETDSPSPQSS